MEAMPSNIILMMSKESRVKQVPKNQESSKIILMMSKESRVKQVSKNQESSKFQKSRSRSRFKIQESREDSIKISIKRVFQNIE